MQSAILYAEQTFLPAWCFLIKKENVKWQLIFYASDLSIDNHLF